MLLDLRLFVVLVRESGLSILVTFRVLAAIHTLFVFSRESKRVAIRSVGALLEHREAIVTLAEGLAAISS